MIVYAHEDVLKMMNTFHTSELNRDLCMAKLTPIELAQQEALYTDKQVREAIVKASLSDIDSLIDKCNEIIQSLKPQKT